MAACTSFSVLRLTAAIHFHLSVGFGSSALTNGILMTVAGTLYRMPGVRAVPVFSSTKIV